MTWPKLPEKTISQIHELRNKGKSYEEISNNLGISCSVVGRYLKPELRSRMKEHRRRNWISTRVNGKRVRLRARKRSRTDSCELCGKERTRTEKPARLVWHHWNNHSPELGLWLCLQCHSFAGRVDDGLVGSYLELKEFTYVVPSSQ